MISGDHSLCCGCGACAYICPMRAIVMETDDKGFAYPRVDASRCCGCGRCDSTCVYTSPLSVDNPEATFIAYSDDEGLRKRGSSGGVFGAIAYNTIQKLYGVVYGAAYDHELSVAHVRVERMEDLPALFSSKYVQSDTTDVYGKVEQDLREGRHVLYSGTMCQIAALLNALDTRRIDRTRLLTVGVICHGVPAPMVWRRYLDVLAERYGARAISANMRDSETAPWHRFRIRIVFENGSVYSVPHQLDPFFVAFLEGRFLRESCFHCSCKGGMVRGLDVLLGDAWGAENSVSAIEDDKGASVVMAATERGLEALYSAGLELFDYDFAELRRTHESLFRQASRPKHSSEENPFMMSFKTRAIAYIKLAADRMGVTAPLRRFRQSLRHR